MVKGITVERILTAALMALIVYALTAPFRRFIDEKLEKENPSV